jgi:hypothetical protein
MEEAIVAKNNDKKYVIFACRLRGKVSRGEYF